MEDNDCPVCGRGDEVITLRDFFAGCALIRMGGIAATWGYEGRADEAFKQADAMLKEREK